MNRIAENFAHVKQRITEAAQKSGRSPESIQLVVVTKGVSVADIETVLNAGATIIAENRIQEAQQKFEHVNSLSLNLLNAPESNRTFAWHLIGHLQRNKVKPALSMFSLIHSVDSLRLVEEISKRSIEQENVTNILLQVNTTGEESKYGLDSKEVPNIIERSINYANVRVCGLMTMGKFTTDPEENRPAFESLRTLADNLKIEDSPNVDMRYLSMGMTGDFEVAIEEGANLVRIGRAIFA